MGIRDLNPLLFSKDSDYVTTRPMSDFSGHRLAVDASNFLINGFTVARQTVLKVQASRPSPIEVRQITQVWLNQTLDFIYTWLRHGVTPVFVFETSQNELKRRAKLRKRARTSAVRCELEKNDVRARTSAVRCELEKNDVRARTSAVRCELEKSKNHRKSIYSSNQRLFMVKFLLDAIGIPTILTDDEGERVCSALCVEGEVMAVWSGDTDNLPYGCPRLVVGFGHHPVWASEEGSYVKSVNVVYLNRVLSALGWPNDLHRFRELCILLGCDYNERPPNLDMKRCFEYIHEFGNLDALVRHHPHLDLSSLVIETCREAFATKPSHELIREKTDLNLRLGYLQRYGKRILSAVGLGGYYDGLIDIYSLQLGTKESSKRVKHSSSVSRIIVNSGHWIARP